MPTAKPEFRLTLFGAHDDLFTGNKSAHSITDKRNKNSSFLNLIKKSQLNPEKIMLRQKSEDKSRKERKNEF